MFSAMNDLRRCSYCIPGTITKTGPGAAMNNDQLTFFHEDDDQPRGVLISKDKLYLSLVGIILLLVITFSLGVERGKKVALTTRKQILHELQLIETATADAIKVAPPQGSTAVEIVTETTIPVSPRSSVIAAQSEVAQTVPTVPAVAPKPEDKPVAVKPQQGNYTIQLASYGKNSYAQAEADRLIKEGYQAFVVQKGKYVILCAGRFATSAVAQETRTRLRKKYKDCFIRKL
jgi:cell division septation protein DedD